MTRTDLRTLRPGTRIFVAGHRGMVGSALRRRFAELGYRNVIGRDARELDLRDAVATERFFRETRPDVVIGAAARVGGIMANHTRPADFISDNIRIQVNLLDSAVSTGVERFLFLGSSCIYPKFADQPIRERALMTGPLEPTNEAYAVAKIAGIAQVAAIRRQHGLPYICVMPASLYGPGDNFDARDSHVIPGLMRRFHDAVREDLPSVTCWGSGSPMREFLYVDDLADACHHLLNAYDGDEPVNVGTGRDVTVRQLAEMIAETVGYRGRIEWDRSKPDGTPRKILDVRRIDELGWSAKTTLRHGLRQTYQWFLAHQDDYRGSTCPVVNGAARG